MDKLAHQIAGSQPIERLFYIEYVDAGCYLSYNARGTTHTWLYVLTDVTFFASTDEAVRTAEKQMIEAWFYRVLDRREYPLGTRVLWMARFAERDGSTVLDDHSTMKLSGTFEEAAQAAARYAAEPGSTVYVFGIHRRY